MCFYISFQNIRYSGTTVYSTPTYADSNLCVLMLHIFSSAIQYITIIHERQKVDNIVLFIRNIVHFLE